MSYNIQKIFKESDNFLKLSSKNELFLLKNKPSSYWEKAGRDFAMNLFSFVSNNVEAYKKFLKENKINLTSIKNYDDFINKLPIVDKSNYLKKYNYLNLFPQNSLKNTQTFSATSGSSGEPFFLPRGNMQDLQYQNIAEVILRENFQIHKKKTLAIIGFGLGVWIGGIFTYKVFDNIASKGHDLSIVPVGPNKESILNVVKKFGVYYDQIILCGYPPFLKDLIDESKNQGGISWDKYNIKLYTAAEGFPPELRRFFVDEFKIKNPLTDITNIYGTVEFGTMAYETAFSNLIKDLVDKNKKILPHIFKGSLTIPTLAQYYPHYLHFETVKNEIAVSGYGSSIPMVKYKFPDIGEVIPFDVMIERFKEVGIDVLGEAKKHKISHLLQKIPFISVYERSDMSTSFVGIILYPEYIKSAFYHKNIQKYVTGRFALDTVYNKDKDQELFVHVELKKDIKYSKDLKETIQSAVLQALLDNSTEYHYLYGGGSKAYKKRILPIINLSSFEDPKYFNRGGKQKWTVK